MAIDFRDGKSFPRRGREPLGEFLWLARVFDKARAAAGNTIHDYIYPCPMDLAVMKRWGITSAQFDDAVRTHSTDRAIHDWLDQRVSPQQREAAHHWLLEEKIASLERQDREEAVAAKV